MPSYNKVILIGHLTRDPELRFLPSGAAIAEIGIATNRRYKVDGEQREEVCFTDCTAFGKTAELAGQYLKKGRAALIEGRLKLDEWDDKNTGKKRSKLGVVIENIQFMGSRDNNDRSEAPTPTSAPSGTDPNIDVPF